MDFNPERVRANVQKATTQDLLDRLMVDAAGMEPVALEIIEAELRRRGVTTRQMQDHAREHAQANTLGEDGPLPRCSFCARPAVRRGWGWHRLWGILPLFPRLLSYCAEHGGRK